MVGPESVRRLTTAEIIARRAETDAFFREDASSPLTAEQKAGFAGLDYFPPDLALQFVVPLVRFAEPEELDLPFSGGDGVQRVLRWGHFDFRVDGVAARLHAYRPLLAAGPAGHLFVPFRDATSGVETYPGGRYLEIPYEPGGWYSLDFNLAFAPYCAHNPDWSCPLTPRENALPVTIRAGERGPVHAGAPSGAAGTPQEDT